MKKRNLLCIVCVVLLILSSTFVSCTPQDEDETNKDGSSTKKSESSSYPTSVWDGKKDTSWYTATKTSFELTSAEDFAGFASLVNDGVSFENIKIHLKANIDLNNKNWTPIGGTEDNHFKGAFYGNGCKISNLYVKGVEDGSVLGLFGYIHSGSVSDLSVSGSITDSTGADIGGIAGILQYGAVKKCSTSITIKENKKAGEKNEESLIRIGGLVGLTLASEISQCFSQGSISASGISEGTINLYVGGLIGEDSPRRPQVTTINNCYSTVNVTTTSDITTEYEVSFAENLYAAGFIGKIDGGVTITNCYASGNIKATASKDHGLASGAGFIGKFSTNDMITNCFAVGNVTVSGKSSTAMKFGSYVIDDTMINCFSSSNQSISPSSKYDKVTVVAAPEDFKDRDMFKNRLKWDLSIWNISSENYPTLKCFN